jgi:hypothetical protein
VPEVHSCLLLLQSGLQRRFGKPASALDPQVLDDTDDDGS